MGRAFSPHGLWGDAPLSRGDTPGWYGDAPLALEEWFLSGLWPCWRPEEELCRCRVTRGNGTKTERPMGRAFSPHGLWGDAPLSRGDTPGWYWTRRWRSKNGFCRGCRRVGARKTNALVVAVLTPGEKMRLGRAPVWGVCVLTSGKRMGMGIPGNVRNPRDGGPCWRLENEWGSPCTLVVLVDCTRLVWIAVLEGQRPGTIPAQADGLGHRTK